MILPLEDYKKFLSTMPIVCVDCLVINEKGEYLLVKRKNEPLKGEFWVPGGRLHKNEHLTDAVHRKIREELGIDINIIRYVGYFEGFFEKTAENADGGVHVISFVYLVKPVSYNIKLDDQSFDWGWFRNIPQRFKEILTLQGQHFPEPG